MNQSSNYNLLFVVCGVLAVGTAAPRNVVRADHAGASAPGPSSQDAGIGGAVTVTIGPREIVRQHEEMPFVMDASLAALRSDDQTWFFYHVVDWGKCNEKYLGTVLDPFQTKVWRKSRDEMYDLNGWYDNVHHAGLWLTNILQTDDGDLLGVVHIELHYQEPNVNKGEDYAIGVVHSSDGGDRWTFCGEIVRPRNSKANVGGTPLLVVKDHLHVYFNDHGPGGRRLAVARAKLADVVSAARNRSVTQWRKYRDGSWDEDGLTGFGSAVLPSRTTRGGHPEDFHADAAYNRAAEAYMITSWCYEQGVGRLYLHLSEDGVQFDTQHLLDEEPGQWMPYSTFLAHPDDRDTNDMSTVGETFYVLINHKSATNYGIDSLYRRSISVSRTRTE